VRASVHLVLFLNADLAFKCSVEMQDQMFQCLLSQVVLAPVNYTSKSPSGIGWSNSMEFFTVSNVARAPSGLLQMQFPISSLHTYFLVVYKYVKKMAETLYTQLCYGHNRMSLCTVLEVLILYMFFSFCE
jgi:hypothetical protein